MQQSITWTVKLNNHNLLSKSINHNKVFKVFLDCNWDHVSQFAGISTIARFKFSTVVFIFNYKSAQNYFEHWNKTATYSLNRESTPNITIRICIIPLKIEYKNLRTTNNFGNHEKPHFNIIRTNLSIYTMN